MSTIEMLQANLLSPVTLAFCLGVIAKLARSELSLPKELYTSLSIYLLFALGIKGGLELRHAEFQEIFWPAVVTLFLGCLTPATAFLGMRYLGRFSVADAAGVAAHYGSVSAVTFIAAQQFCTHLNLPLEGYLPTLLTLMESPGIHVALAIGAIGTAATTARATVVVGQSGGTAALGITGGGTTEATEESCRKISHLLHEILTGRTMVLLVGGMLLGFLMGEKGYHSVQGFFEGGFKGALMLFILEMGLVAAARIGDLRKVGPFLVAFGILLPIFHGAIGVALGHWAGLSVGGCTVLGAMAASASYIAAPPAVRLTLPEANPTYYLTLALAITFPFNLVCGIPLYHYFATCLAA
ncbi:MAG: sodium-dependent bicarbonate transport family permease [Pirellulales bacterium]